MKLYPLLLRLLPRDRRERYGGEMSKVFEEQLHATRSGRWRWLTASAQSAREVIALVRFALRERTRLMRFTAPDLHSELRWARRGLRARGGTALLTVGLLSMALAANALVFAVTDALVFTRVPYADADRLFQIQRIDQRGRTSRFLRADVVDRWREHADLFSGVEGHLDTVGFLKIGERVVDAVIADVTPGLTALLGVAPRWGRPLHAADAARRDGHTVLIAESLARELFGDPQDAIGQTIRTSSQPLLVVGVMASPFRFPTSERRAGPALARVHPGAAATPPPSRSRRRRQLASRRGARTRPRGRESRCAAKLRAGGGACVRDRNCARRGRLSRHH
jgi:hypothetical protein